MGGRGGCQVNLCTGAYRSDNSRRAISNKWYQPPAWPVWPWLVLTPHGHAVTPSLRPTIRRGEREKRKVITPPSPHPLTLTETQNGLKLWWILNGLQWWLRALALPLPSQQHTGAFRPLLYPGHLPYPPNPRGHTGWHMGPNDQHS